MAVRTTCRIGRWGQAVLAPSTFSNHQPPLLPPLRASASSSSCPARFPPIPFFPSILLSFALLSSILVARAFVFLPANRCHLRHRTASIIVTTPSVRHTVHFVYLRSILHGILGTSVHRSTTDRPMLVCVMYVRCAHQAVVGDARHGGRRRPVGGSGYATRPQAQSLRDPRRVCLR